MADFSIGKVSSELGDIQRNYTWELLLTPPQQVIEDAKLGVDGNKLAIRCRSVVIPGRSQDVITSNYMGMEQFFPGRVHFTNPFNITFEEFQDRTVAKFLYSWQQLMFDTENGGASKGGYKSNLVAQSCQLQLLDYAGKKVPASDMGLIEIQNAWPESVAEVPLSYAENSAVQYSLALRYDTWRYKTAV